MLLNAILGCLALLSLALLLWQWLAGWVFPLHRRATAPAQWLPLTLLKPLRGCDAEIEDCLRSWFRQSYGGPIEILFGVGSADDPVCAVVRRLLTEFPATDARLVVCSPLSGANLKVSKLVHLERLAKHEVVVISDADVRVPPDLLANLAAVLNDSSVGLVNCFYQLANPTTLAMQWEAVAINADFWSQVLQAQALKPLDFALGAVMGTRRQVVRDFGGFEALADCLADDYQLGNRIARRAHRIALCPVVVECWSAPMRWGEVWKHQLRWARTIRVCQPMPYFFSILSNATLWPWLWAAIELSPLTLGFAAAASAVRALAVVDLERRLTRRTVPLNRLWLAPLKDLLQTFIWGLAFLGNRVEWRGERLKLRRDGTLIRPSKATS